MTVLAKLVASHKDFGGYIIYVFECLEGFLINDSKYVMVTRFPNWEHKSIAIDDIGYLEFVEIRAGIDKWFNGANMVPYAYNLVQFIRFIKKPDEVDSKYIM